MALAAKIKKLDPTAALPATSDVRSVEKATQILERLQDRDFVPPPPSQEHRDYVYAQGLQNEVATLLDQYVKRGIVSRDDYAFPKKGDDPVAVLQDLRNRLETAASEHNLPLDAKVKRLEAQLRDALSRIGALEQEGLESQFRAFRIDALSRIGALEQELSHT